MKRTKRLSKKESMDKRFALVDTQGVLRYPYMKTQQGTGKHGFVLGDDRFGQGEYVRSIDEVVRGVVFDGKKVRVADDPPTRAKGSNGLSLHAQKEVKGYVIAPELVHLVHGAPFAPLIIPPPSTPEAVSPALGGAHDADCDPADPVNGCSVHQYLEAISALSSKMTKPQRNMLVGHANAVKRTLSMQSIAELGGYADFNAANIHYGSLGHLFADQLGAVGLVNYVQALAHAANECDEKGQAQWVLRPSLVEALEAFGWIEEPVAPAGVLDATAEIDNDPQCSGISETTRKALINARVGQGGFRRRMLHLWNNRCALSGCTIASVLVASHALAWKASTNEERLDEFNGLPLAASIDRLFDSGLIAFADDGVVLKHPSIDWEQLEQLGIAHPFKLSSVHPRNLPYLRAHRKRFGFEQ